jgi:hypothetical protein
MIVFGNLATLKYEQLCNDPHLNRGSNQRAGIGQPLPIPEGSISLGKAEKGGSALNSGKWSISLYIHAADQGQTNRAAAAAAAERDNIKKCGLAGKGR